MNLYPVMIVRLLLMILLMRSKNMRMRFQKKKDVAYKLKKKLVKFSHPTLEMSQVMMETKTMTVEMMIAGMRIIRLILYHLMMRKKIREGKLVRMQHQPMRS